ncbi:hypothetical protein [Streptomyces sp. NPDC057250]|uniref:hypothetical protein n=1 Tax=Streptomyces sp. NPDC057250 TaxID=3346068 RepID=UPI003625A6CA
MKSGAIALYNFLAMHLSMSRRDRYVWPTRDSLAALMGYPRADKISPFVNLLVEIDALVVIKIPNGAGPEKRNVYRLRRNPPQGYAGHVVLSEMYAAMEALTATEGDGVAGQPVCPENGVDVHPENGSVTTTTLNKKKTTDLAPTARSAGDARRATDPSSAREAESGCAATEEPGPVVDEEAAAPAAGGQDGAVPAPRRPQTAGGKGAGKKSPFPPELRQAIYATEALLPAELRAVLAEKFPYGHLPNVNRQVIALALESRTPAQLGERAARRWTSYGYERDHHDGLLRSPLGVVEELLRPTPYCPEIECEDGTHINTGADCKSCEARIARRRADLAAGLPVANYRPTRLYRDAEQCDVCDRPLPGDVPEDRVCRDCRTELERAAAHVTGTPAPAGPVETDPGNCAAPPSDEYRAYREQREQERLAALRAPAAPF